MNRTNAAVNAGVMYAPLVFAAIVIVVMSPVLSISILALVYLHGLTKLVRAKISVFRERRWIGFGPSTMDAGNRTRYFQGYALIGIAAVFNVFCICLNRI